MAKRDADAGADARRPWSLEEIEGAALRKGHEKHLDKELELPTEEIFELRIPVLEEMHRGLQEVISENGWEEEEGLRTLLAVGLGYMRVSTVEEAHNSGRLDDAGYSSRLQALRDLVARYEARYSVMKFKAYQFQEKSKILEMRVSGLVGTERLREAWAIRVRDRLEALEAEHRQLEQRFSEHEQATGQGLPRDIASPGWWARFRTLLEDFKSSGHGPEGGSTTSSPP